MQVRVGKVKVESEYCVGLRFYYLLIEFFKVRRHPCSFLNKNRILPFKRNYLPTRKRIRITGLVQGVGFRPFVWKRASDYGLSGWVSNDSNGVTIEVQGIESTVEEFLEGFEESAPPLARIDSLVTARVDVLDESEFVINESSRLESSSTPISPEISVCEDCLAEFLDSNDRRYQYPFINCTNCGPRFTITQDIPYDRPLTTMKSFPMCAQCQSEYDNPSNRRFHAQPNACASCGPKIWFVDGDAKSEDAMKAFNTAIGQGKIVAVKGIGGFHLACDAQNGNAIESLRQRKGRIDKPFAVMVREVEEAKAFAIVSDQEQQLLESKERPIVLLSKRTRHASEGCETKRRDTKRKNPSLAPRVSVSELVAPGNNFIGVMLPYSPLHYLLANESPLVLTSGNITDEPIVRTNEEAKQRLAKMADCFLLHDREIHVVCDDSVVRCVDGDLMPIRRSRGYAPLPVRLTEPGPSVLAVGGEIKSTFCTTKDDYAYMSQHIGDMANFETLEAMKRGVDHFLRLFRVEPQAVAADLHPGYLSGQWAERFAVTLGVPLLRVQHHFAHVASLIAEHGLDGDQKVIGCCFDGTGYGTDKTIWGGEFMMADSMSFDRFACLDPFSLPGGDASIKRPWRVALSLLQHNETEWDSGLPSVSAISEKETKLLRQQLEKEINCVSTSSMGRLFDAVASLIGVRHEVNYEAQAAMEMEAIAQSAIDQVDANAYSFEYSRTALTQIRLPRLINAICEDVLRGVEKRVIAAQFHHAVSKMIADVCISARSETQVNIVGLTGGVFQNVLLLRLAKQELEQHGFQVLTHFVVPPNDGGIALGQAVIARNWAQGKRGI